jgi:hypothetical protein
MSKKVTVELTGTARILAGRREVSIKVQDGVTWRDVIAALAQASPALVREVITKDRRDLVGSFILNLGGAHTIHDLDEEARLEEGDHLALLSETC